MTTKAIGIKEFRKNITSLWKESKTKQVKYIVMYHSRPILEVKLLQEKNFILEKYIGDIAHARKETQEGKLTPQEEVFKKLGL